MGGSESKDGTTPVEGSTSAAANQTMPSNADGSKGMSSLGPVDPLTHDRKGNFVGIGCTGAARRRAGIGYPYSGEISHTGLELSGDGTEKQVYLGFENYGNSCYANSVTQMLLQNPPLRHRLLIIYDQFYSNNVKPKPRPVEETILSRLCELCHTIHSNKKKKGSMGPKDFIQKVKKENIMFRNTYQQDAHEFLMYVLNDIIDSEKQLLGITDSDVRGPLQILIQGETVTETICQDCETRTTTSEPFLAHSVEVEPNKSLNKMLDSGATVEWLAGEDKFKCTPCSSKSIAKRTMKLLEPPPLLFIHLKRFKFIESQGQFKKLAYRLSFPDSLGIGFLKYGATLNREHFKGQLAVIRERILRMQVREYQKQARNTQAAAGRRASTAIPGANSSSTSGAPPPRVVTASGNSPSEGRLGGNSSMPSTLDSRHAGLIPPEAKHAQDADHFSTPAKPRRQPSAVGDCVSSEESDVVGQVLDLTKGVENSKSEPSLQNPYFFAGGEGGSDMPPSMISIPSSTLSPGDPGGDAGLVPPMTHYRLVGFVVHAGAGLNLGHYICIHRTEQGGNVWRRFDDEKVTTLSDREVELFQGYAYTTDHSSTATAYILSYIREDVLSV